MLMLDQHHCKPYSREVRGWRHLITQSVAVKCMLLLLCVNRGWVLMYYCHNIILQVFNNEMVLGDNPRQATLILHFGADHFHIFRRQGWLSSCWCFIGLFMMTHLDMHAEEARLYKSP